MMMRRRKKIVEVAVVVGAGSSPSQYNTQISGLCYSTTGRTDVMLKERTRQVVLWVEGATGCNRFILYSLKNYRP
jgi:saccharopine dehydrogenase-like NADP-dependent oxidoreductase